MSHFIIYKIQNNHHRQQRHLSYITIIRINRSRPHFYNKMGTKLMLLLLPLPTMYRHLQRAQVAPRQ